MESVSMKIFGVFLAVCIFGGYAKSPSKINGGVIAEIVYYPHQVSLHSRGLHFCSGSIINPYFILTAASCIVLEPGITRSNIQVLSGTNDQLDLNNGTINDVSIIIYHEDFDPFQFWANDIAILKLKYPLSLSNVRKPICPAYRKRRRSSELFISGWGWNNPSDTSKRFLRAASVRYITRTLCQIAFNSTRFLLNENQDCVMINDGAAYVGKGDGGGPITLRDEVVGIISITRSEVDFPIVVTQVYPYFQWISTALEMYA